MPNPNLSAAMALPPQSEGEREIVLPRKPRAEVDEHNLQGGRLLYSHAQLDAYARAAILEDRARAAQPPTHAASPDVGKMVEAVKDAQTVIADETVNYGRNHERTIAARIAFHMTVDRLAAATQASSAVGAEPVMLSEGELRDELECMLDGLQQWSMLTESTHADILSRLETALDQLLSVPLPPSLPAAQPAEPLAWQDVKSERQRQISAEGWTPEHDDEHDDGSMALAAACYAMGSPHVSDRRQRSYVTLWPWDQSWWKQSPPRRMLVKAGALILAEIERIDRAAHNISAAPAGEGETR